MEYKIMKFFTVIGVGVFTILCVVSYAKHVGADRVPYTHDLIPSTIVDKKKLVPIKVPRVDCIITVGGEVEEAEIAIEELMATCVGDRKWLKIKFGREATTF
jgi:hypothetical protein